MTDAHGCRMSASCAVHGNPASNMCALQTVLKLSDEWPVSAGPDRSRPFVSSSYSLRYWGMLLWSCCRRRATAMASHSGRDLDNNQSFYILLSNFVQLELCVFFVSEAIRWDMAMISREAQGLWRSLVKSKELDERLLPGDHFTSRSCSRGQAGTCGGSIAIDCSQSASASWCDAIG